MCVRSRPITASDALAVDREALSAMTDATVEEVSKALYLISQDDAGAASKVLIALVEKLKPEL